MISLQMGLVAIALSGSGSGSGETVFLDFYADWCAPCRAMGPTIQSLVERGYPVRKVNVDGNRDLAARFKVSQIPCYVMLVDGKEVDRVVGGTTFSRLARMCRLAAAARPPNPRPGPIADSTPPRRGAVTIPPIESRPPLSAVAGEAPQRAAVAQPRAGQQGWQFSPASWSPPKDARASDDEQLIMVTVRLRVKDSVGHSCGSGTIIDAREGQALVLTCAHIFRESQGRGPITADLFTPGGVQRVPGRMISYNLERDVALVCVDTPFPVATARVAPAGFRIVRDDRVVSVGCDFGNDPTVAHSRVTSVDKYAGPPNVQVAGQSVEGRSGGGLFSPDGLVIGVCNAADPQDDESFFAALGAVHAELDQAELSYVYREQPRPRPASEASRAALVAVDPPPMPERMPRRSDPGAPVQVPLRPAARAAEPSTRLTAAEQAALDEIRRHLQEGAEVICVVRSRNNPLAKSEIFMLDKASPDFLKQLAAEAQAEDSHELIPTQTRQSGAADHSWRPRPAWSGGGP